MHPGTVFLQLSFIMLIYALYFSDFKGMYCRTQIFIILFFSSHSQNMHVIVSSLRNFRNVWWCDYFLSFRGISNAYCCFLFVPIYNVILNWCLYVIVLMFDIYNTIMYLYFIICSTVYLWIIKIYFLIVFSLEIKSVWLTLLMIVCFVILLISVPYALPLLLVCLRKNKTLKEGFPCCVDSVDQ